MIRVLLYLAALAACVLAVYALLATLRPRVVTTTLVRGPVVKAVYATGTISPIREFAIRAKRAGTLEKVLIDKGDRVTLGQPLGAVADSALVYAVDRARAELVEKQARADEESSPVLAELDARIRGAGEQLVVARREEMRLRQLVENNSRSTTDLDRAIDRTQGYVAASESLKAERATRRLELDREVAFAQSTLRTAEWDLAELQLLSPIDGVVLDRPTSPGTRVAVNEVLMRVADVAPARLVMRAAVDEEDITSVNVGQKVIMTLYAFEQDRFEGRVKTIYAEADASRRTFEVDIEMTRPNDRFQPGMTGELAFVVVERQGALILPSQALQGEAVYIVRAGVIERATPTLGVRAVDRIEVLDGLPADAAVVISPIDASQLGKRARARAVDPRSAVGLTPDGEKADPAFKGWR